MTAPYNSPVPRRVFPYGVVALTALAAGTAVVARLVPAEWRLVNFAMLGAVSLFAGARLRSSWAVAALTLGPALASDWLIWWQHGQTAAMQPTTPLFVATYAGYLLYAYCGRKLAGGSEAPLRVGAGAVLGGLGFFLLSNFGFWLDPRSGFEASAAGLLAAYRDGLPFYPRTLVSDLLFSGVLFAAHAVLSRTVFPAERVASAKLEGAAS